MGNKKRRTKAQKIKYQQGKLLKIKELEKLNVFPDIKIRVRQAKCDNQL